MRKYIRWRQCASPEMCVPTCQTEGCFNPEEHSTGDEGSTWLLLIVIQR
jgi:hypothetical protein